MKKLLLILLFPLALVAQNFKHESGGVTGIESYSEGTVETDTLRTRYIRLLDGLNSDSIASYIYFDGDTSRWTGDPIKIGNNSIVVKDDTVKISNAMLTVSGQVQADTLVPYHNSTIYIRHFTVDTIEIVKYFHQLEIGVVDSMTYFARDGDTLKIDPSISANVIEYEHENVTVAKLDSAGNWTSKKIVATDSLRVGPATVADQDATTITIKADGASGAGVVSSVVYQIIPVAASDPANSYLNFTASAGKGYRFETLGVGVTASSTYVLNTYSATSGILVNIAGLSTALKYGLTLQPSIASSAAYPIRYSPGLGLTTANWDTATGANMYEYFNTVAIGRAGGSVLASPSAASARQSIVFSHNGAAIVELWSMYGDGTPAGKTGTAHGEAAFSTGASADTVTIAGALTTDIYTFEWTSDPGTPGAVWFERKDGSFIVHTAGAVTATPTWMWTRRKKLN